MIYIWASGSWAECSQPSLSAPQEQSNTDRTTSKNLQSSSKPEEQSPRALGAARGSDRRYVLKQQSIRDMDPTGRMSCSRLKGSLSGFSPLVSPWSCFDFDYLGYMHMQAWHAVPVTVFHCSTGGGNTLTYATMCWQRHGINTVSVDVKKEGFKLQKVRRGRELAFNTITRPEGYAHWIQP